MLSTLCVMVRKEVTAPLLRYPRQTIHQPHSTGRLPLNHRTEDIYF